MTNSRDHEFKPILITIKEKYGLNASDKMCDKCGIVINKEYRIVNIKHGIAIDSLIFINDYELNCNEIMIKQLLE